MDVPKGIRFGWHIGVLDSYSLSSSFIPPNHRSALDHLDFLLDYIELEVREGHYTGPFSPSHLEQIIGPFCTSPLGVIPKPGSSKFHLIQDHSFPQDDSFPSINSMIDSSLFECDWGTFSDCWLCVTSAPPGAQAAIFDVEAAHRCSPIAPEDQYLICVMIEVNSVMHIYLDHCACFGCSSSSGLFGRPGDTIITIFAHKGVKDTLCWADDFIFFRYPLPSSSAFQFSFPFDESLIFSIVEDLDWPWSPSKHIPFASSFPYLGFIWDLSNKSISIPLSKCKKYLARLEAWVPGAYVSLRDVQGVLGCLQHCTLVLSDSCSHLLSFYCFCSAFKDPHNSFVKHCIPKDTLADAAWWCSQLSADWCGTPISLPPSPLPLPIFVDASSSFGVGLSLDGHWLAWRLLEGWHSDGCDIGWAEMVAIDLGLHTLIHSNYHDCHFICYSDNQGVVGALNSGHSCSSAQNTVLRHIVSNFRQHNIWLSVVWVCSEDNLTDGVS